MTMHVSDTDLDKVGVAWAFERGGPWVTQSDVRVDDEDARRVLVAFLEVRPDWDDLAMMAECVASRRSCSTDYRSVTFPSEYFGNPGSIYLADGTEQDVEVGDGAGLRLLARWFRVIADGVEHDQLDVASSSRWAGFLADVRAIELLAAASTEGDAASGNEGGRPPRDQRHW